MNKERKLITLSYYLPKICTMGKRNALKRGHFLSASNTFARASLILYCKKFVDV